MYQVAAASPDVLAYRDGGIRGPLASLLAVAAGLGLFYLGTVAQRERPALVGAAALASVVLTLGGAVAFVRTAIHSGFTLDRAAGNVTTWRHGIVPLSSATRDLAAFHGVLLSLARVQKRYRSVMVYLVGLAGDQGEAVPLDQAEDYQTARRFAAGIASFLGLPLTDATGTVALAAAQPPTPKEMPRPPATRCRVSWEGATLHIEEPRGRLRNLIGVPLGVFVSLALTFVGLGVVGHFLGKPSPINPDPLVAAGLVVGTLFVIFVAVVTPGLPEVYDRRRVEVDRAGLRFRSTGLLSDAARSLRGDDIVELRIAFGHLLAVTPRDLRVVCGRLDQPLPRAELEWLRDEMLRALHL
jgi:hypothetical protein